MEPERQVGYILFPSHTEAMALYQQLKDQHIRCTLAPTPRACSVCCGVSIRLEDPADLDPAQALASSHGIQIEQAVSLPLSQAH